MQTFGKYDGPLTWINHTASKKELNDRLEYKGSFVSDDDFQVSIRVSAPKGFETDGASVPRIFRWAIDNDGAIARGAIGHDGNYRFRPVNRALADALALQMWLDDPNVKPWRAYLAY